MKKIKKFQLTLYITTAATISIFYQPVACPLNPLERAKQIIQAARTALFLPYNLLQVTPQQMAYKKAQDELKNPFPCAKQTYQDLNEGDNNFLMSIGISMSQISTTENTIHPEYLRELLEEKSQIDKDPKKWLADRHGYTKRATSHTTKFSLEDEQKILEQLKTLGVYNQKASAIMPSYRLSIEIADFVDDQGNIDQIKIKRQALFLKNLNHPLTVFHHYTNPKSKPNLFESKEDIIWFADKCAQFIQACPGLTYVCPISQIIGFGMQVSRQKMLPPFSCNIDTDQFLQNIIQAQVEASNSMKKVNPTLKVLVSHQWKPMKPKHCFGDPRHAIECAACTIADRMYNQKFVQLLKNHKDSFDGIALSIYPALYFDKITPLGNNCTGMLDPQSALEAIVQIHQAFPDKEIHIIETGCNSCNPEIKKQFVDMTLYICKLVRNLGITVKSCYFWGHTNDPYFEWNKAQGTSFFGPFENLEVDSINEYGKYLQEILK